CLALCFRRTRMKRPVHLTGANLTAVGGREWKRGDKHRVYFNSISDYLTIEIEHYKSGRISWAAWEGEEISNSQAYLILQSVDGVCYDVVEEKFYGRYGWRESRIVSKEEVWKDRKSTRLNSSHVKISYAVFCLKKKNM